MPQFISKSSLAALLGSFLFAPALLAQEKPAKNYEIVCSYQARISNIDKVNHKGESLVSGHNAASVVAMIRQDRANVNKYDIRNREDVGDCGFDTVASRNQLEQAFHRLKPSPETIKAFVEGNPLIHAYLVKGKLTGQYYFFPRVVNEADMKKSEPEKQVAKPQPASPNKPTPQPEPPEKEASLPEVDLVVPKGSDGIYF
ncbi:hypothetical protein A4G20_04910 [Pasteurellaceae bacterium RH1A]|nr:hypothetical protein A4G20_04910 [Pasteurellaceae bacterium RH1A]